MNTTATAATTSASRLLKAERSAIATALALQRQPALLRSVPRRDIPADVIEVLRIASGHPEAIESACTTFDVDELALIAAAELYLQLILTNAKSDDKRMLCLPLSATATDLKDHRRLLLKWLHPDRNRDNWESALFLKVKAAATRLEEQLKTNDQKLPAATHVTALKSKRRHSHRRGAMPRIQPNNVGLFRSTLKPMILVVLFLTTAGVLIVNQLPDSPAAKILISAFSL